MSRQHSTSPAVDTAKLQAKSLLRSVRGTDRARALAAAERFRVLPQFAAASVEEILTHAMSVIQQKHALEAIARENGYDRWDSYRRVLEHVPTNLRVFQEGDMEDGWTCDIDPATGEEEEDAGVECLMEYNGRYYTVVASEDGGTLLNPEAPAKPLPRLDRRCSGRELDILSAVAELLHPEDASFAEVNLGNGTDGLDEVIVYDDGYKRYYDVLVSEDKERVVEFRLVERR